MPFGNSKKKRKASSFKPPNSKQNEKAKKDRKAAREAAITDAQETAPAQEVINHQLSPRLLQPARNPRTTVEITPTEYFDGDNSEDDSVVEDMELGADDILHVDIPLAMSGKENMRRYIAFHYEYILHSPPEEKWHGRDGTIAKICSHCCNHSSAYRTTVKKVLTAMQKCYEEGSMYSGKGNYDGNGGKPIIEETSV